MFQNPTEAWRDVTCYMTDLKLTHEVRRDLQGLGLPCQDLVVRRLNRPYPLLPTLLLIETEVPGFEWRNGFWAPNTFEGYNAVGFNAFEMVPPLNSPDFPKWWHQTLNGLVWPLRPASTGVRLMALKDLPWDTIIALTEAPPMRGVPGIIGRMVEIEPGPWFRSVRREMDAWENLWNVPRGIFELPPYRHHFWPKTEKQHFHVEYYGTFPQPRDELYDLFMKTKLPKYECSIKPLSKQGDPLDVRGITMGQGFCNLNSIMRAPIQPGPRTSADEKLVDFPNPPKLLDELLMRSLKEIPLK